MADLLTAMFTRLSADPAVAAIVGTKIYPMIVPPTKTPPYIRLQYPSNIAERHLKGDTGARTIRVQVDSMAMSATAALALAEAAREALLPPATAAGLVMVTADAEAPTPEPGTDTPNGHIFWTRVDLRVWHRLA